MFGLDEWLAGFGGSGTIALSLLIAILLGLRHATDPDHLTAVATIVAGEPGQQRQHAARLGLAWGAGHATTLFAFGLPIVLFSAILPAAVLEGAEVLIGLVIVGLALRLLIRWRRGLIHSHEHEHAGARHVHPHGHTQAQGGAPGSSTGDHRHVRPVRTRLGAYGIGLVHGVGGSAGVGILLLSGIHDRLLKTIALLVFAVFTALSMAVCSGAFGAVLTTRRVRRAFDRLVPGLGAASVAFGAWYIAGAMALAPYPF